MGPAFGKSGFNASRRYHQIVDGNSHQRNGVRKLMVGKSHVRLFCSWTSAGEDRKPMMLFNSFSCWHRNACTDDITTHEIILHVLVDASHPRPCF